MQPKNFSLSTPEKLVTSSLSFSHNYGASSSHCLTIRRATSEDINRVSELLTHSFHSFNTLMRWLYPLIKLGIAEDLRDRIYSHHTHYYCLIAIIPASSTQPEQIVGTIEISLRNPYGWGSKKKYPYISNLAVKEDFRRQGIASQLLQKCEEIAQSWGFENLLLHVLAENHAGQKVYLHNGYIIKQEETDLYSLFIKSKRRLLLEKSLTHQP